MKNALLFLFFLSCSFTTHSQSLNDSLPFAKFLTELKDLKKLQWPLPNDQKISPVALSAPLDTTYNWQLLCYRNHGWVQITGQKASDYEKTYINIKPEMRFSSALLEKTFQLSEPGSNWKIRQQPSASGGIYLVISSYRGNPIANITSWEEEDVYVFMQHGLHQETHFPLDHLLEESADPTPFREAGSVIGNITVLNPFMLADTGSWELIGYEEWAWQDILGRNAHVTNYRKYTAKAKTAFSGKELQKVFITIGYEESVAAYMTIGWRSYTMSNGWLVIQANTYQPGNMTDWGYTSSYYFKRAQ